jgi:ABC-type amino acid transport substrate-binding protein
MNKVISISFILLFFLMNTIIAQKKLIIGTKSAKPFSFTNSDSTWQGISFDLFNFVCDELEYEYEIREYEIDELLEAVETKKVDVAVAALTINSERESRMDFSHPYYISGLGIAVLSTSTNSLWQTAKKIFSIEFIEAIGLLSVLLFIVGLLTWFFERKKNKEEFGDGATKGLGSSFWWAAVTMTTVGYGDKSPKTVGGRLVALVWMFAAIIIISSFTAAIASALTINQMGASISDVNDLYSAKVGTIEGSASEEYLKDKRISYFAYPDVQTGCDALAKGKLDAFVHDSPLLKFTIIEENLSQQLHVLPNNLEPLLYGFAFPENSKLREPINRVMLEKVTSKSWQKIIYEYFGE